MEPFVGQIQLFGFNFNPIGWALCQGQLLSIASNTALFSLLGTIYGGDGRSTFGLPDLRGRSAIGFGNGPGLSNVQIGQRSGAETVTLNASNLPSHNHNPRVGINTSAGEEATAQNNVISNHTAAFNEDASSGANLGGVASDNVGGNIAFNIRNPYLGLNYSIALQGIYPSRS